MNQKDEQEYKDFIEVMRVKLNEAEKEADLYKLGLYIICTVCAGLLMIIIF